MPLYNNPENLTDAIKGEINNGHDIGKSPEVEVCSDSSWHYLFIHHTKVEKTEERLKERFKTFVHKTIIYKRENKRIKQKEYATISGLLFVQGNSLEIQLFLTENFMSLYLVKDCASGRVATIPDEVMQPFMQLVQIAPTRIRFMPHTFDYYQTGNTMVRITSGILAGMEGYRIRVSRDKCLITSVGGMTVAIKGIYKESFENIDEYVRQRREQLSAMQKPMSRELWSPLQIQIDECFYEPHNQLDIMALSESVGIWTAKAENYVKEKLFDEAAEVALFVLEEIGSCLVHVHNDIGIGRMDEVFSACRGTDKVLEDMMRSADVATDLKDIIETGRESLMMRFPFLPVNI